ncbi:pyridoxal phosphate-dependent aminotransferase [Pelagibacterium montanilacus]|uniref:pyridoxal phosphate-dependent aminotransferase n=1 Tax=Pelagibacterium montanilacus TaxID=2185280 RepID=UPI000F8F3A57|nr:pyridoxal phosphate-dependent aminotransferase [Pelagibacterium montanilacus]
MTSFAPRERAAISALSASAIREIANGGMGRTDIDAFWFGESDIPTPRFIVDAATRSLEACETFYSQNLGIPALREAIAAYGNGLRGGTIEPARIGVTGSGVSALMLAAQLVLSPGDRAVVVTPIWPNIAEIPKILGAEVIRFPLVVREGSWSLDVDRLIETLDESVTLLVFNAPNNPTGFTLDAQSQKALLTHCRRLGIWVLSDEVYERLVYTGARVAPGMSDHAEPEDRLILVNSFSKAWLMTGWRVGWLTLPAALAPALEKIIEYNTSCVPVFVQKAALAALTDPEGEAAVTGIVEAFGRSRALLMEGFARLGRIEAPDADGAMYSFFRVAGHDDDMALAKTLLGTAGLGLAPGRAFGPEGKGWLRWCFAARPEKIARGLDRLEGFLARE